MNNSVDSQIYKIYDNRNKEANYCDLAELDYYIQDMLN